MEQPDKSYSSGQAFAYTADLLLAFVLPTAALALLLSRSWWANPAGGFLFVALVFLISAAPGFCLWRLKRRGTPGRLLEASARALTTSFYLGEAALLALFVLAAFGPAGRGGITVGFPTACSQKQGIPEADSRTPIPEAVVAIGRGTEVRNFFRFVRRPADCRNPEVGFEAFAVGVFSADGPLEVWTVNDHRVIPKSPN